MIGPIGISLVERARSTGEHKEFYSPNQFCELCACARVCAIEVEQLDKFCLHRRGQVSADDNR